MMAQGSSGGACGGGGSGNNNNDEKLVNEKLKNSLSKMIKTFDTYVKEASDYEQLEENLKHMEETDENFHKHELVEYLTDRLDSALGPLIDNHVNETFNKNKFDGDIDHQNRLAHTICDEIMKTREFNEFEASFKSNIIRANESLMKNFHHVFIESLSSNNNNNGSSNNLLLDEMNTINDTAESKSLTFTNDFNEFMSSPDNSMNQNSFVFFNSEQFPAIAQNLDPKKSDQVRLKAVQQLLSIPASDPQAADHWVAIRKFLIFALRDSNEKISETCLKLHSRTLASSHHRVSVEIYITLIEHYLEHFRDRELEKRSLKAATVDITTPETSSLLKKFRLINDYAKDVTNKWARYPESFIETIINETFRLFDATSNQKLGAYMSPVHYISLVDINAIWFIKWMHGHDSRKILIETMRTHESFLQSAINSLMNYATSRHESTSLTSSSQNNLGSNSSNNNSNSKKKQSTTSSSMNQLNINAQQSSRGGGAGVNDSSLKRTQFKRSEIEYAHFIHSLAILRKILCFKSGRKLFPLRMTNNASSSSSSTMKEISIKDLIKLIIQIIFETASLKQNEYSPSKNAAELLQDLCVAEETCQACLCNEEIIDMLIKPIRTILQLKKAGNAVYDENCMLIVANVLSKLASTHCGYRQLLYNDSRQAFMINNQRSKSSSAAHTIVLFVQKALANQLNYNLSKTEIAEYLYLTRLIYSQCQGVCLVKEYELNKSINECWRLGEKESANLSSAPSTPRQFNSSRNNNSNNKETAAAAAAATIATTIDTFKISWSESLLDNLVGMASTPKGVFYLNETGLVKHVVNYLYTRYKSKLQVGKCERFGYGFILSELVNAPSGCFYLNESSMIQYLIEEIWTELEYGSDDFMSAFPRSYSVEPIDRDVYKPMLCLINILSSFASVYEMLADVTVTPRDQYGIRDLPKGLIGILDRLVFLDRKAKIRSLNNLEQSHTLGLRLISYLLSDLDVLLLLESQYGCTKLLLNLQRANRRIRQKFDYKISEEKEKEGNVIVVDHEQENNQYEEDEDEEEAETSAKNKDEQENYEEEDNEARKNNDADEVVNIDEPPSALNQDNDEIIVDMLSVERNYVLVQMNVIGGHREKLIPTRMTATVEKLFDKLPVPSVYVSRPDWLKLQWTDEMFSEFLEKFNLEQITKNDENKNNWLSKLRKHFFQTFIKKENNNKLMLSLETTSMALNQIAQVLAKSENWFYTTEFKNVNDLIAKSSASASTHHNQLSSLQLLGVKKAIEYGVQINVLQQSKKKEHLSNLKFVQKSAKLLLKSKNVSKVESFLNYAQEDSFPGFDWFVTSIFLIHKGDPNSTLKFLFNFNFVQTSAFLWWSRLYSSSIDQSSNSPVGVLSSVYTTNGININLSTTCHYIELILKLELPLIFSAFRMSGLAPSQICLHWLKQCFWNYLDWPDIVNYLSICVICGVDYQTYFCIAILKHLNQKCDSAKELNQKIMQQHTNRNLQIFLRETQIKDFHLKAYLDYMQELELKYRQFIMDDLKLSLSNK